jgi:putrescine transport system substrate-binding protein
VVARRQGHRKTAKRLVANRLQPAYLIPWAWSFTTVGINKAKVRKDIRIFSSAMIDDLAGGKACVALGWAGDINIAKSRAIENKTGAQIEALVPKTGGLIFFDNLAITKDARHPHNTAVFINYFLKPEVSAQLTNELGYTTANKASTVYVSPEVVNNKSVFLEPAALATMVPPSSFSNTARESLNNTYTAFKKGK